jgi:hypothetical protein
MGAAVVPVVLLVVLLALGVFAVVHLTRRAERDTIPAGQPTLRYSVPEGQDPAAVLVALRAEGLDAATEDEGPHQDVVIACPTGVERERPRVRAIIQHARHLGDDEGVPVPTVRFADEQPRQH